MLDDLQAAARPHGLRFGPDPSTHSRCTLGGMLGNNACGSRALAYGRTADNLLELDVVCGTGRRLVARPGAAGEVPGLEAVVRPAWPDPGRVRPLRPPGLRLRTGAPAARARRRPGQGSGRRGTLAVVLQATLRLVRAPAATTLVVLGYPDMGTAADAVGVVLPAPAGGP